MTNLTNPASQNSYFIPAAIVIAGALIAGAVYFSNSGGGPAALKEAVDIQPSPDSDDSLADSGPDIAGRIQPVTAQDHIRGNPDAPIKLVEFSDLECPFCKKIHGTLQQVVQEYGEQVAWVYRHFPLDAIHSKARKEAEATECAAELGGNNAFWRYIDRLFEATPSNNGLDLSLLPQLAQDIGLDRADFEQCLNSGKYADKVAAHLQDAMNSGGRGTPYTVILTSQGEAFPVSGALPLDAFKQAINQALDSLK